MLIVVLKSDANSVDYSKNKSESATGQSDANSVADWKRSLHGFIILIADSNPKISENCQEIPQSHTAAQP